MTKQGAILVNLGSPDSPSVPDVREYLDEFLSDPRVIDIPWVFRQALLKTVILPFRPSESAEAYEKIWGPEGSPLIATTKNVASDLRDRCDMPITIGMRYGNPSIATGIDALLEQGVDDIFLIPQYPHYAMSSYETVVAKTQEVLEDRSREVRLTVQPPFYDDSDYIDALIDSAEDYLEQDFDKILFSYHGVPERHIKKGDPSGCYCLEYDDCCQRANPAHGMCYRHQVHATSWEFADRVGLPEDKYEVTFQSRLGPDPWLEPFTADRLEELPSEGDKRVMVITPAFVADCLETIEEIGMEGRETFMEAGGKEFTLIPCLNENPGWVDLLERFIDDFQDGDRSEYRTARAAE
jgi:ferrochelatase